MSDQLFPPDSLAQPNVGVFSLDEALPRSSTLIEASAGTGKTFTLTHLAANFIERDALPISQLLLVTYTRAAAGELRDRLRRVLRERAETSTDSDAGMRLRIAAEEFDTATITTIHGFCQQVLTTLGVNVPLDPAMKLLADEETLITQIAADLLAGQALAESTADGQLPKLAKLTEAIRMGSTHPGIVVAGHPDEPEHNRLAQLTADGLDELDRRLAARSLMTYQQLLNRVAAAVNGPKNSGVVDILRRRFRVALIDEFQDTDPVQWEVFRLLFAGSDGPDSPTLVLVGDPKQAIYSFRGADIATYLDAKQAVTRQNRLDRNWRSTPQLIAALNSLFAGSRFGSSPDGTHTIDYDPVIAARKHDAAVPGHQALKIRCFDMAAYHEVHPPEYRKNGNAVPTPVGLIRHLVGLDLVSQVRSTLADGVRAEEITVLVTSNKDAARIQRLLSDAGLPAVLGRAGSVIDSPAADQIRRLLWAMERPASSSRVRAAALGWFYGLSARDVDAINDEQLAQIQVGLRDDSLILRRRGVAELAHHLRTRVAAADGFDAGDRPVAERSAGSTLGTRLLATPGGERHLTDLNHLWELLSDRTGATGTSASSALEALTASADPEEQATEVLQRRTEADGGAVMVMTVHVSKGLENRVVMVPFLWTAPMSVKAPVVTHDPVSGEAMLRVALEAKGEAREAAKAAVAEEGDRLVYVALTRAKERLIVWAAPGAKESHKSRLMCRLAQVAGLDELATMSDLRDAVDVVQAHAPEGAVALETFISAPSSGHTPSANSSTSGDDLQIDIWDRHMGPPSRRWSFSALTADHDDSSRIRTAQRPEDATGRGDTAADDEGDEPAVADLAAATQTIDGTTAADPSDALPDPWLDLGAGTAFGTLVHEVLEEADLQAPDLEDELARAIAAGSPPDELDQPRLASAVAASVLTPMGGSLGSLTLAGLPRAHQLRELDFDLPLEGAARPTGADLARCVDAWLPADDPLAGRTFALGAAAFLPLAGMLTGSIDLTIRVRASDGGPDRYVVADYKTNLLAPWGTVDPEAAHPDRLVDAMVAHDYPLQALLYEVALHRYLRWRLPAYDPEAHLGGAAYLFLRGMAGPDTPVTPNGRTYGVFTWQPPTGLILALSNLLAGAELDEVTP